MIRLDVFDWTTAQEAAVHRSNNIADGLDLAMLRVDFWLNVTLASTVTIGVKVRDIATNGKH